MDELLTAWWIGRNRGELREVLWLWLGWKMKDERTRQYTVVE